MYSINYDPSVNYWHVIDLNTFSIVISFRVKANAEAWVKARS